jgi:hypothetical protein
MTKKDIYVLRIENALERNVLAVALDHLEEHLMDIRDEVDVKDRLKAVRALKSRPVD